VKSFENIVGDNIRRQKQERVIQTALSRLNQFKEYGLADAIASKAISPDPKRQIVLRDAVVAELRAWHRPAFDPENDRDDLRIDERLRLLQDRRRVLWDQEQLLDDERRKRLRAIAAEEPAPRISGLFFWGAVGGYAATLGPAFEPLFRAAIKDGPLRWGAALGLGALLGLILVFAILNIKLTGRSK